MWRYLISNYIKAFWIAESKYPYTLSQRKEIINMDNFVSSSPNRSYDFETKEQRIKAHLKTVVSDEVYNKWIENFVFEKIDSKKILIGYYGSEPLKEFNKNYREIVWIHICSVVGYVKKLKIIKRRKKIAEPHDTAAKKIKSHSAKLVFMSILCAFLALAAAVTACNYVINRNFAETFYSVSSLKVNNAMRIIQISDLHSVSYGKNNSKLTERIQKLKPDIIIFTGDCLDSSSPSDSEVINLCSSLKDTAPMIYVYGNNEVKRFYDINLNQDELDAKYGFSDESRSPEVLSSETDDFEKELEAVGVKVLKNEKDTVTVGSTQVDIYGVLTSNPSSFWSYSGKSFNSFLYDDPNNLKITAIHEPTVYEVYNYDYWGDLILCGHTHGGTAKIPFLGPLYTHENGLFPERSGAYVYGRYSVSGTPLIVSSGLSNKNILRLNNKPELVIIDINKF